MSNYNFSPTLDGLNNVDGNSINSNTVITDYLTVNLGSSVPTLSPSTNNNEIASTAFVNNAISNLSISNYVDLTSAQTITGEKTFSNNIITNSIRSASGTTDINIGQNLTTGDINLGTTFIGPTMNVALNWGTSSNSGQLALRGGSFTLASTGIYNQSSGATFDTNISTNQSSGIMNIGTSGNRSGAININTGATSTAPINISSGTNTNAPITIGSTASTTQTCNINAITSFSKIPSCVITAINPSDLVNKNYVDTEILGGLSGYVDTTSTQTITGSKTFSGTSTFDGLVNVTGATAGNINLTVNNPASNNIYLNFGNPTVSARIRTHYINALNRVSMNVDTTGKEFSLGVNTNDYIIFKPSTSSTNITSNLNLTGSLFMNAGMAFSFIPIGTINTSVVATVPTGFLYCDGSAVSRDVYAGLFLAIGTTYGAGDGSTTYNLPNFKGCFLRGSGTQNIGGVDYTAGSVGTAQQDAVMNSIYSSNEGFRDCAAGARECVARSIITSDPVDTNTGILARFPRQAIENRPVNHSVYYYIKF